MAKKVRAIITLQIQAGKANPAPPVGPALGQHGINIMAFFKEYNERTAAQAGTIIPAQITIFEDRSFTFVTQDAAGRRPDQEGRRHRQGRQPARSGRGRHAAAATGDARSPR